MPAALFWGWYGAMAETILTSLRATLAPTLHFVGKDATGSCKNLIFLFFFISLGGVGVLIYLVSSELVNVSRDRDAVLIQKPALKWLTTVGQAGVFIVFLSRRFPLCSDSKCGEVVGVTMCWQTDPALPFLVKAPFHLESWLAPPAAWRTGGQLQLLQSQCCPKPCTGPLPESAWQQEAVGVNLHIY